LQRFVAYENRSLSTLFHQALSDSADKPNIFSHLHYKLALPLFPFLILLAIGPFSLKFSRSLPFFFFAACALFAFAALCTILDGMLILGENRVLSPFIAIWTPLLFAFGISARFFLKI
jgi:lipopolysaccharide export LptBFGC system permease protein LptF